MKNGRFVINMFISTVICLCLLTASFAIGEECGIGTAASCITLSDTTEYAYTTEYRNDPDRYPESGNVVVQEGKNGSKTDSWLITYEDGIATGSRYLGGEYTSPVTEIISVPTKGHTVETREETTTDIVPFQTRTVDDPDRMKGDPDKVIQEGKNGSKTLVYTVTYTDGMETNRVLKSETVTVEPVEKIVSVATGEYETTYETVTVEVPFETVYEDAPGWKVGEESVGQEGQNGLKEITYSVQKDKNGKEVSRKVSSEKTIKETINKTILRGTFVPTVTYEVVYVPDLPECDASRRNTDLDADCADWAMKMAQEDEVQHSDFGWGESVGGWGSIDEVVYGRHYEVISTQNGQLYSGNVSLGSHGGQMLAEGSTWGAGCVARSETQPDGSIVTVYFACARSTI